MNKLYFDDYNDLPRPVLEGEGWGEGAPIGKSYPKIQILTIEELLNNTARAEFPDLTGGTLTFKKAQREKKQSGQEGMF